MTNVRRVNNLHITTFHVCLCLKAQVRKLEKKKTTEEEEEEKKKLIRMLISVSWKIHNGWKIAKVNQKKKILRSTRV